MSRRPERDELKALRVEPLGESFGNFLVPSADCAYMPTCRRILIFLVYLTLQMA